MTERFTQAQFDLEYFFELYPDLICVAGMDGFLKKINPAVHMLLGYSDEELYSLPIDSFIHPEDQASARESRESHINGEKLVEYEVRYLTKQGEVVWLSWTSVLIERDNVIFSIAKDITKTRPAIRESRFSALLEKLGDEQRKRFSQELLLHEAPQMAGLAPQKWMGAGEHLSPADKNWLQRFELLVRGQAARSALNLELLSREMAMSERQLYRQVNRLIGITPKKLVTLIRLHIIWEALASGDAVTLDGVSALAGYNSAARCRAVFMENYGVDLAELI